MKQFIQNQKHNYYKLYILYQIKIHRNCNINKIFKNFVLKIYNINKLLIIKLT